MPKKELPSINLEGVDSSRNVEASLLELYLGIYFVHQPKKIPLTPQNTATLIANNRHLREHPMFSNNNIHGFYDSSLNAFFYSPKESQSDIFTSLHENMRAYIRQKNPFLMPIIDNLKIEDLDDLEALLNKLNPQTYADVLFTRTLAEGIAEWGATEVYGERESAEQGHQFDSPFAHEQYILSAVINLPKFLQPLDMMKSVPLYAISGYNQVKKTKNGYLEFGSSQLLFSKIYTVLGHATVNDIMQILLTNNVSRKDAINSVILNPPQSFDELFEAESYCQRLLGTENGL